MVAAMDTDQDHAYHPQAGPLNGHSTLRSCRSNKLPTQSPPPPIQLATPYLQPFRNRPFKRRRTAAAHSTLLILALVSFIISTASAAFVQFDNCLPDNIVHSNVDGKPLILQFTPLLVDAKFNNHPDGHLLNLTIYGNVSGQATEGNYPSPNSPSWDNPKDTFGKILKFSPTTRKFTTLYTNYDVLTYTAFDAPGKRFCSSVLHPKCPIGPAFNGTVNDTSTLPAFSVGHLFFSSYAFTTIVPTITVNSGDRGAPLLVCVSAAITPALGDTIKNVVAYIPVLVLLVVAIATILAATASPWGTTDFFKWTSNYGRDEDLLRLVTPGFADCLQYIQFVILTGSLSLSYPGFYQPVVRQVSWAALMFTESFVSHDKGSNSLVDGIYVTQGEFGFSRMRELVGMSKDFDLWAGTAAWIMVIIIFVVVLCQVGFFLRWALRKISKHQAEDLRRKNLPFTGGNVIRVIFNFFLLPLTAVSTFQLLIAWRSNGVVIAFAVVLLVAILAFTAWTIRLIFTTKPRAHLFDDLPTLLLYGPLYNTYSDGAAPFALAPVILNFIRGVAIGAVQPSGISQLIILAVCEVLLILALHAFRPFPSATHMNAYHTCFATIRLATVLLMISFAPALGVTEGPKGWIGYVILLIHLLVLILGFFLNAIQKIIEVAARLAGAGVDKDSGAPTRGGLNKPFGHRQLSRRKGRSSINRLSQRSEIGMLSEFDDAKSSQFAPRSRSVSASSAILLNQRRASDPRVSSHLDRTGSGQTGFTDLGLEQSPRAFVPAGPKLRSTGSPGLGLRAADAAGPYYRPPRQRRQTGEFATPGDKSRGSADWTNAKFEEASAEQRSRKDSNGRPVSLPPHQQLLPNPAYLRAQGDSETNLNESRDQNVDYAVREVDYYYGVRGPALSSQPTRKLKTGPADPVGAVSSATGWFKNMFGGKTKETGKGFEVVRSSRLPPQKFTDDSAPKAVEEPYRDSPQLQQQDPYLPGQRTRSNTGDTEPPDEDDQSSSAGSEEVDDESEEDEGSRVSPVPPTLDPIGTFDNIDLPSRFNSNYSKHSRKSGAKSGKSSRRSSRRQAAAGASEPTPAVPIIESAQLDASAEEPLLMSVLRPLSAAKDIPEQRDSRPLSNRVPFSGPEETPRPSTGGASNISTDEEATGQAMSRGAHRATASNVTSTSLEPPRPTNDRPTSYGYVSQYRTSDRIHQPVFGDNANAASSAEVVNSRTPRRSRDA